MRNPKNKPRGAYSKQAIRNLIDYMKERVIKDPSVQDRFKEYRVPLDRIKEVEVEFADLDVSAKTKNKKIYINKKFITGANPQDPTSYLAHEIVHYLQQLTGDTEGHYEARDYLDKTTEVDAFETQVDFKARNEGEEEAEEYVDHLLDYHGYKGKRREDKKEELM